MMTSSQIGIYAKSDLRIRCLHRIAGCFEVNSSSFFMFGKDIPTLLSVVVVYLSELCYVNGNIHKGKVITLCTLNLKKSS